MADSGYACFRNSLRLMNKLLDIYIYLSDCLFLSQHGRVTSCLLLHNSSWFLAVCLPPRACPTDSTYSTDQENGANYLSRTAKQKYRGRLLIYFQTELLPRPAVLLCTHPESQRLQCVTVNRAMFGHMYRLNPFQWQHVKIARPIYPVK